MIVKPGYYRHFKGTEYIVIGIGTHSETMEVFVVYHKVGYPTDMWVRPIAHFLSETPDGKTRFEYLGPNATGF